MASSHKLRCDHCGEHARKMHHLVVQMDRKVTARWTLCLSCAAIKQALIASRWPRGC